MLLKVRTVKKCISRHYWYFNYGFKFQYSVCNGCHDLTMGCLNLSHINITVKDADYSGIIHDNSKSNAIHFLENSVLDHRGYI